MDAEGFVGKPGRRTWWGSVGVGEAPGRAPVLTVHGGPGMPHDCLEPIAGLADGRRVVFYDQYGCGRSDRAADPTEYDIDLFVEELDSLRNALDLEDVHLFAHSYGGALALEYLLSGQRTGVRSLVLSNTFGSIPALAIGWAQRISELPAPAQMALSDGPARDERAYGAALGEFVGQFVFAPPMPEPMTRSQAHSGPEVYMRMHGSSWFAPDGQWSGWDVTDRLSEIKVPALVISGRRDQCVPELSEALHAGIPESELRVLDTAHLPFFEDPEAYLTLIDDFLRRAEERTGS